MMVSRFESSATRLRTAIAIGIASFVVIVAFAASRANHRANVSVASLAFLDDSQPSVSSISQPQTQAQAPAQPQPVALPTVQPLAPQPAIVAAPAAQVPAPVAATPAPALVESPAPPTVQPAAAPVQTQSKSQLWTHAKALTTTTHSTGSTPAVAAASATAASGILMISTKPPCEIIVDGKPTHLVTPQRALTLGAGPHQLTLINTQQGIKRTAAVTIDSHHPTKLIQDYLAH
jgi:hypothetical protein